MRARLSEVLKIKQVWLKLKRILMNRSCGSGGWQRWSVVQLHSVAVQTLSHLWRSPPSLLATEELHDNRECIFNETPNLRSWYGNSNRKLFSCMPIRLSSKLLAPLLQELQLEARQVLCCHISLGTFAFLIILGHLCHISPSQSLIDPYCLSFLRLHGPFQSSVWFFLCILSSYLMKLDQYEGLFAFVAQIK